MNFCSNRNSIAQVFASLHRENMPCNQNVSEWNRKEHVSSDFMYEYQQIFLVCEWMIIYSCMVVHCTGIWAMMPHSLHIICYETFISSNNYLLCICRHLGLTSKTLVKVLLRFNLVETFFTVMKFIELQQNILYRDLHYHTPNLWSYISSHTYLGQQAIRQLIQRSKWHHLTSFYLIPNCLSRLTTDNVLLF